MKAHQILIPVEGCHTLPFDRLEQAENYTMQKGFKDYVLQEVEISPGERFQHHLRKRHSISRSGKWCHLFRPPGTHEIMQKPQATAQGFCYMKGGNHTRATPNPAYAILTELSLMSARYIKSVSSVG